jgi:hypothetical protein
MTAVLKTILSLGECHVIPSRWLHVTIALSSSESFILRTLQVPSYEGTLIGNKVIVSQWIPCTRIIRAVVINIMKADLGQCGIFPSWDKLMRGDEII